MSAPDFFRFVSRLNAESPEFPSLTTALHDSGALVAYATSKGFELSLDQAEAFIAESRRHAALSHDLALSDGDLAQIQGGISWTGLGAAVLGGAATVVAAAFIAPAAIATGTVLAGVAAIGGSGVVGGGIGAMLGGAADLISDAVS